MSGTFYWHDYETSGTDPARDRPVQFAGQRTDENLQPVGDPLVLYARPAPDMLPQPEACLLTGISPLVAMEKGVNEAEFIGRIHGELAQPGTCSAGYNSIRFDEEFTRHTLYRNFFDPYAHAWKNGNSRWDIIDAVRLAYALRPEVLSWPEGEADESGAAGDAGEAGGAGGQTGRAGGHKKPRVSFKLEDLTAANGIEHGDAHDALADVHATIALARLLRERAPRLFAYALKMRDKHAVQAMLDVPAMAPALHISGMFGAARRNAALVAPLAYHPVNRNEILCFDLSADPAPLAELNSDELRRLLFTPWRKLSEADRARRPAIKSIHINRSPIVATPKLLEGEAAERLGIDTASCAEHRAMLQGMAGLPEKLQELFREKSRDGAAGGAAAAGDAAETAGGAAGESAAAADPERMLYSGFFSDADQRVMAQVRAATPEALRDASYPFEDKRLPELLFRYRARNFPGSLTEAEQAQWEEFRYARLTDPAAGAPIVLDDYFARIEELQSNPALSPARQALLQDLLNYGDSLLA